MPNLNKVLLMGNLTRDPVLRFLPSQTPVVEFGMAMNRRWKTPQGEEKEEVTFVDVSAFGRTAEVINQYFQKGKPIFIEGRLRYDQWEDKNGGGKRSRMTVVAESFEFLGPSQGGAQGAPAADYDASGNPVTPTARPAPRAPQAAPVRRPMPQSAPQAAPQQQPEPPISEEQHFGESDIPF